MDVLGTVASTISILEASIRVVEAGIKWYSDFKDADATLRHFTIRLNHELETLKHFKALCDNLNREASHRSMTCLKDLEKLMQDNADVSQTLCTTLVATMDWLKKKMHVNKVSPAGSRYLKFCRGKTVGGMSFAQKLRWSWKEKKRIERLLIQLDHHQRHFDHALLIIQSYITLEITKKLRQLPSLDDLRYTRSVLLAAITQNSIKRDERRHRSTIRRHYTQSINRTEGRCTTVTTSIGKATTKLGPRTFQSSSITTSIRCAGTKCSTITSADTIFSHDARPFFSSAQLYKLVLSWLYCGLKDSLTLRIGGYLATCDVMSHY